MKAVYIAGPFRGANQWEQFQNIHEAETLALAVWRMGAACLCPHANTAHFQEAAPDDVWLAGDLELMRRCDAVLLSPRWRESKGAIAEREHAEMLCIPVFETLADLKDWLEETDSDQFAEGS